MHFVRKLVTKTSVLLILSGALVGCGGGGGGGGNSSTEYRYTCDPSDTYNYAAKYTHTVSQTTASRLGTVIFIHGKTGWPYIPSMHDTFFNDLAAAGYDVQSLQMPWATTDWDGSSCQALNLIQEKATEFKVDGEKLILVGHSMGGAHIQILAGMDSTKDVDGIVTLAPGHMPHLSTNFQNTIASDVSTARQLVANSQGGTIGTYQTPNSGTVQNISLSAENYLSFHDINVFGDHRELYPRNRFPLLWVAGNGDPLTTQYRYQTFFNGSGNPSSKNQYSVVNGTHLGMVANSGSSVVPWINAL